MKHKTILLVFIILASCSKEPTLEMSEALIQLLEKDPTTETLKAFKKKDYRFMGVYGYSLTVPGLIGKCEYSYDDINPIEGTSDYMESYEEQLFNSVAQTYASNYNFIMQMYLVENNLISCDEFLND